MSAHYRIWFCIRVRIKDDYVFAIGAAGGTP